MSTHQLPSFVTRPTYLDSQEVVYSRDDDVDSSVIASLSSQIILKIYIRAKEITEAESKVLNELSE